MYVVKHFILTVYFLCGWMTVYVGFIYYVNGNNLDMVNITTFCLQNLYELSDDRYIKGVMLGLYMKII